MKFLPSVVAAVSLFCLYSVEAWIPLTASSRRRPAPLRMTATQEVADTQPTLPSDRPPLSRTGHDNEAWKAAYSTCPEELPPTVLEFPGLPSDFPAGTLFRNGHARFESDDGIRVQHMFDADGMVSAITFDPKTKRVLFRNRFVRTEGYVQDKKTGSMTRPGSFGTKVSGGFFKNLFRTDFKNVANTNVLFSHGNLYALWEGGWPHRLDPLTLENDVDKEPKGFDLHGLLGEGDTFAAHYRYDPETGAYVNFGTKLNPAEGTTEIRLYELDAQLRSTRPDQNVASALYEGTGLIHDFALTRNWCVFSLPPASINKAKALQALLGMAPFASVVKFEEAPETQVVLIPRELVRTGTTEMSISNDSRIKVISVPYHFSFHFANAFEDADGNVVLDMVVMNKAVTGADFEGGRPVWESVDWDKDVSPAEYVRYTLNPELQQMSAPPQVICARAPEFPSVPKDLSTRKHRYAYTVGAHQDFEADPDTGMGSGPSGAILKVDTDHPEKSESFAFLPHEFVGEAVFVPKRGAVVTNPNEEDKGYILSYVADGIEKTTDLVVFDVQGKGKLEAGPVARLRLPTYIPLGLHGAFVEGLEFEF